MLSHSYTYNGYTFNDSLSMPAFLLDEVEGFSAPQVKHQQQNLIGIHGFEDHFSTLGGRFIVLRGRVGGIDEDQMNTELEALTGAFTLPSVPSSTNTGYRQLVFSKDGDVTKYVNAKIHSLPKITKTKKIHRMRSVTIGLKCKDPRIYALTEKTATLYRSYLISGFPSPLPRYWGYSNGVGGQVILTNAGNIGSPPVIRINGPCTYPSVHNITHGYSQLFQLTLITGEYIDIDVVNGTATHSDGSDALAYESNDSSFTWIEAGNNVFEYRNTAGAGSLDITYHDAWTSAPR